MTESPPPFTLTTSPAGPARWVERVSGPEAPQPPSASGQCGCAPGCGDRPLQVHKDTAPALAEFCSFPGWGCSRSGWGVLGGQLPPASPLEEPTQHLVFWAGLMNTIVTIIEEKVARVFTLKILI